MLYISEKPVFYLKYMDNYCLMNSALNYSNDVIYEILIGHSLAMASEHNYIY